jgi:amino acid adenylation domain-containing protein
MNVEEKDPATGDAASSPKARLEERLRAAAASVKRPSTIPKRSGDPSTAPLSSAQERLWLLDQLAPASSAYNMTRSFWIEGPLDAAALARALDRVVDRHEALRVRIETLDGSPVQRVVPPQTGTLRVGTLEDLPEKARREAALERARADADAPFDLARGPLLRALLLRLGPDEHLFHLTAHHIVTDAWSMGILFREVSDFLEGKTDEGSAPPGLQYPDFCAWQATWLETEEARSRVRSWAEKLRGAPQLPLPGDRARPPVSRPNGVSRSRAFSRRLSDGVAALARSERATPYMVLLAAFEAFLHRHAGGNPADFLVATPVAGRGRPELEDVVGFFANTLVVRADLSGGPTFRQLLGRVRASALDAWSHADVPLEKLVEILRPPRQTLRDPLASALFSLRNAPDAVLRVPGARAFPVELEISTARFDLELHARESAHGLHVLLVGAAELFDSETLARMLERLEVLLESAVADPDRGVADLELLPEEEKRTVLDVWNRTGRDRGAPSTVVEMIEEQARRTPDAIALDLEGDRRTYGELWRSVRAGARRLAAAGVRPEVVVALLFERSIEMVESLVATLAAGGAFLPLDPAAPAARLEMMLSDAEPAVVLTTRALASRLPQGGPRLIRVDAGEFDSADPGEGARSSRPASLDDAAYVLYTSGSTGAPKAVVNTHRGLANRLLWMQETYRLAPEDRVLQKTPYTFDVSVWEFLWPLMTGARLVLARPGGHRDPTYLAQVSDRAQITTVHFVPSILEEFIRVVPEGAGATWRRVFCSGEALSGDLARRFLHRFPNVSLYNLYGPTEASIDVTAWECRRSSDEAAVPIGRPIANTRIYLLDDARRPVPIGVPGEIHIAGDGVARGYVKRPELTAERFLPDPFGAGGRLYRTGDLGRYRADGAIEFLGRRDEQVKIRGHRIEPGEIEAAIRTFPGVHATAVVARRDGGDRLRLVAYVVAEPGVTVDAEPLREHLRRTLPEALIPSAFVSVKSLPLTTSGKLDRAALPAPGPERPDLPQRYVAPAGRVEETLASIWQTLLGIDRVGVHDNFFDLGGHSLLATRAASRVRDALGAELPLSEFFQHPTIAECARVLGGSRAGAGTPPPAIPSRERTRRKVVIASGVATVGGEDKCRRT